MREHYCHCCRHWDRLADGVHCRWCLDFYYDNGRMPLPGDRSRTAIERLYVQLDG